MFLQTLRVVLTWVVIGTRKLQKPRQASSWRSERLLIPRGRQLECLLGSYREGANQWIHTPLSLDTAMFLKLVILESASLKCQICP